MKSVRTVALWMGAVLWVGFMTSSVHSQEEEQGGPPVPRAPKEPKIPRPVKLNVAPVTESESAARTLDPDVFPSLYSSHYALLEEINDHELRVKAIGTALYDVKRRWEEKKLERGNLARNPLSKEYRDESGMRAQIDRDLKFIEGGIKQAKADQAKEEDKLRESRKALAKLQKPEQKYRAAVLTSGLDAKLSSIDTKIDNEEIKLELMRSAFAESAGGAYVREKLRQLVATKEFCAATQECAAGRQPQKPGPDFLTDAPPPRSARANRDFPEAPVQAPSAHQ
jgi:hypothetical protein